MVFNLFKLIREKYFPRPESVKKEAFGIYDPNNKEGLSYNEWKKERANKLKVREITDSEGEKINVDYREAVRNSEGINNERYFSNKSLISKCDFNSKKDYWAGENRKAKAWERRYEEMQKRNLAQKLEAKRANEKLEKARNDEALAWYTDKYSPNVEERERIYRELQSSEKRPAEAVAKEEVEKIRESFIRGGKQNSFFGLPTSRKPIKTPSEKILAKSREDDSYDFNKKWKRGPIDVFAKPRRLSYALGGLI